MNHTRSIQTFSYRNRTKTMGQEKRRKMSGAMKQWSLHKLIVSQTRQIATISLKLTKQH